MKLVAPNGKQIIGTLERLAGVAYLDDAKDGGADGGKFEVQYSGETEVWWDGQRTVERKGQRIFVDQDGDEWPENKLRLR